jgi:membrane fusion protein (multidrug efflux system)
MTTALCIAAIGLVFAGCKESSQSDLDGKPPQPRTEVGVVVASPINIGLLNELPGRLEASRIAQVRAQATGIVLKRIFSEGADVKAGQALFQIEPGAYLAALDTAKAVLARAHANLEQTNTQVERFKPLLAVNAISKQEFANAEAAYKQAQADVAAGKAAVQAAEINFGYTQVKSPISGRIGKALVTEGALVSQAEASQMALVQQIDPIYVNFTQSANEVFALRKALSEGKFKRASKNEEAQVQLILDNETEYPLKGKLLFADLAVDATTGQITLRAEIPNPRGELLPGLYVRVRLEQAQANNAIALPQQAVQRTQQGDVVQVVDENGILNTRKVKIERAQNQRWIVLEGLEAGEQVMVDGFQKVQMLPPGTPVKAVPWSPPGIGASMTSASKR